MLRELRFSQRFNATVLAVKRANSTLRDRLGRVVLSEVDMLILKAPLDAPQGLQQSRDLVVLDQLDDDLPSTHRTSLAISVMLAELLLAGFKVMPPVAADQVAHRADRLTVCFKARLEAHQVEQVKLTIGQIGQFCCEHQHGMAKEGFSSRSTIP